MIDLNKVNGMYSVHHRRIAEVINDVFPEVTLIKLEALHPAFTVERPFAIVHSPPFLPQYVVRTVAEAEIDARLLAELLENNTHDPNSTVNRLDILEMAQHAISAKREVEWKEERGDVMKSIMKSNKNEYKHDGKVLRK
jgi:hypothetical protein